jgi:hypothetical protein
MLCVGGPKHGQDVETDGCYFDCLCNMRIPVSYLPAEPTDCTPIPIVRYERAKIWSDGHWVPIWVVP